MEIPGLTRYLNPLQNQQAGCKREREGGGNKLQIPEREKQECGGRRVLVIVHM